MHRRIRTLHLLIGVFVAPLALMYGVTGFQMAHKQWLPTPTRTEERTVQLEAPGASPPELARELRERHGVRGRLEWARKARQGRRLRIERPGTTTDVVIDRSTGRAQLSEQVSSTLGMLTRLHHHSGFWHRDALHDLWGLLFLAVSCGLMTLGASGIYLWFKLVPERRVGAVLLTAGLGYSLTLLVLIRTAG